MLATECIPVPLTQGKVAVVDAADFVLVSRYRWHAVKIGQTFYARTKVSLGGRKQGNLSMHRLIMGASDLRVIDHADGDGLNNRRSNLRFASHADNARNCRSRPSLSGYRGVVLHKRTAKWQARVKCGRMWFHCGYFWDAADAARAYDAKARELFGEFARLNFPAEASA